MGFLVAWSGIFLLSILTNHVTKCTDVAMYDVSLLMIIMLGLILISRVFMLINDIEKEKQKNEVLLKYK